VWIAFAVTRLGVMAVGFLSEYAARGRDLPYLPFAESGTFVHYADVVAKGYTLENATQFPALPAFMWALGGLGIGPAAAALLVVNVAFLIGLLGIARLGERYVGREASIRGALYLAIFPTAYFFSIASTESLMLLGIVGSALLAIRGTALSWLAAGAIASFCVLSRPPGVFVGIVLLGIAIAQLRNGSLRGRRIVAAVAAGISIPAALGAFFLYLGERTGDALASFHAQEQFDRAMTLDGPWRAVSGAIEATRGGTYGPFFELIAVLLISVSLVIFAINAAGPRWEVRGWALFGAASLLMPLFTGLVWQMPRFALLIPPLFWVLGVVGRRRWVHIGALMLLPMALAFKVVFEVVGVTQ
jgi:hypothetical protein